MKEQVHHNLASAFWSNACNSNELRDALLKLSLSSQRLIYLRFWENLTIEEISSNVRMTWGEADRAIDCAIAELKTNLLKNRVQDGAA